MSFGFSPSDVIAVVNISFKVCGAIRDFPAEHAQLALQLEIFRQSLKEAKRLVLEAQLSPSDVGDVGSAEQQLSLCSQLLQSLDETSAKYIKNNSSGGVSGKKMRNPVRGFKWGVYKRDEIMKLRDDLRSEIVFLNSLLQTYDSRMVQEVNILRDRVGKSITLSPDESCVPKPIQLIDAMDRQRFFDFRMCETWEGFEDFLKFSFKDSLGRNWVDAGRYEIADESKGAVLTAKEWNNSIKPGMILSMAMLLQKQQLVGTTEHNCPSCDFPYRGAKTKELKRVQCKRCAVQFQISSEPRIQELKDDDAEQGNLGNSAGKNRFVQEEKADVPFARDEIKMFRRVHVYLDKSQQIGISTKSSSIIYDDKIIELLSEVFEVERSERNEILIRRKPDRTEHIPEPGV